MASKLGTIYTDFTANTADFEQGAGRVKAKGNALSGDLKKLAGLASRVFVGFSAAVAVKELVDAGESARKYQGQLSLVVDESVGVAKAQQDIFNSAQLTRTAMSDNIDLYTRLARSTEELGISHQRLITVTETLNKAGIVSAATSTEQSNALRQLSQGLAAGALRGDELNSVMENTPRIARAIADGMNLTIGQLREYGSQGKLTSEAIVKAIESQSHVIDTEFKKMPETIEQATVRFNNALEQWLGEGNDLNGIIVKVINSGTDLIGFIDDLGKHIRAELEPVNALGYALISVGDSILAIGNALTLDIEDFKFWASQANKHVQDAIDAMSRWGVVIKDVGDAAAVLQGTVDLGKILWGDDDPTTQLAYLTELEAILRANYSTVDTANDEISRLNAQWLGGLISLEAYTEKLYAANDALNNFYNKEVEREQDQEYWIAAEEMVRQYYSALDTARDEMTVLEAARQAGLLTDLEEYYRLAGDIVDKYTADDIKRSNERINQARKEAQDKVTFANNALNLISELAEANGKKTFEFQKKLSAALALVNAYAAATSAAKETGVAAVATYLSVLTYMLQAYNAINSTNLDSGGGSTSGGSVPSQTLPTQPDERQSGGGSDKITFILIGGSGGAYELSESDIDGLLDKLSDDINNNGRKIIERDSAQAQEIIKAING